MKHVLVALLILTAFVSGAFWLLSDDRLHPNIQALITLTHPSGDSRAFTYLLGLQAPQGQHPEIVGETLLTQVRKYENTVTLTSTDTSTHEIYTSDTLSLPEQSRHCNFSETHCLRELFEIPSPTQSPSPEEQVLLERWHQFIQLDDYQVLTQPGLSEYVPPYLYLTAANRISMVNSIRQANAGDSLLARQQLLANIAALRYLLAAEGHLIGKMVAAKMMSDQIDVLNALQQRFELPPAPPILPLTVPEKSLRLPLERELTMIANLYQEMDSEPGLFDPDLPIPSWLARLLFKPAISTNAMLPIYEYVITGSEIDPVDFISHVQPHNMPVIKTNWIRNPVGTILNRVALPDLHVYVIDMQDLDVKIGLFNAFNQSPSHSMQSVLNTFTNPYYPDGSPMKASIESHRICVPGPAKRNELRCLHGFFNDTSGSPN